MRVALLVALATVACARSAAPAKPSPPAPRAKHVAPAPREKSVAELRSDVEAARKWLTDHPERPGVDDSDAPVDKPLPVHERFVEIGQSFQRLAERLGKDDPDYLGLLFEAGNAYRRGNDPDDALPVLEIVVNARPESEQGGSAAMLILDVLNRAQRYDVMLVWVEKMRENPKLMTHADLKEVVDRLHRQGERKAAEEQETAKDYDGCAKTYLRLHEEDPKDGQDDEVLYDEMVCLAQAGDNDAVARVLAEMQLRHPKSELTERARANWGKK
jgi:hypothetical protein